MRILFIKPNMGLVDGKPYLDRGRMEPLTFAVLAGFTPAHHEVVLCDDRFEPVPYDEHWDVVGINTEVYTARRAYEIADRFRAMGTKVVLGGYHTTMAPEESMEHADVVAVGDTDAQWPQILEDLEAGRTNPIVQGVPCADPIEGIRTKWSVFAGKDYLPVALTQFSRGCSGRCEYCATGNIYGGKFAYRSAREVAEELERDGRKFVFFADDNLIASPERAKELFRELIPLKLRWTAQSSLHFVADPEMMDLMHRSGCAGLVVGFESRNAGDLAAMNKSTNLACGAYDEVVEKIRDAGLLIWAAFLLGYDNETVASIRETVDWALSKKFAFAAFNILTPYPGTGFYARMKAQDRLLYDGKWWLHDDYRFGYGAFRPKQMTAEQLAEEGLRARLQHNTVSQILRRATDRKTNSKDAWSLLTYFAYNPLFRDEMLKKHGMLLGYRGFERSTDVPRWRKATGGLKWKDVRSVALDGPRAAMSKAADRLNRRR